MPRKATLKSKSDETLKALWAAHDEAVKIEMDARRKQWDIIEAITKLQGVEYLYPGDPNRTKLTPWAKKNRK